MDKRADSEKEKKRIYKQEEDFEETLAEYERRKDEFLNDLSDAHRYVERRGYSEQDYW